MSAQNDPLIGRLIRSYRITQRLGSGGMGVVYQARHQEIGQLAAIKVIAGPLARSPLERERFFREARACSLVRHPGLVHVFDFGALDDGTLFMLMEYLDGETLRERLRAAGNQGLPLLPALRAAEQVAAALHVAHEHGVVHRDLKPENLMLIHDPAAPTGERVKVFDFGIARFLNIAELPTLQHEGVAGTATYLAPERCRGDGEVDGQSDVYALGCVLYELLCGRPPFIEEPENLLLIHVSTPPLPPRQRVPELPVEVDALILDMLEKSPTKRPTMVEVAVRLRQLLAQVTAESGLLAEAAAELPAKSPPAPSVAQPPQRWMRWLLGGLALLFVVALGGIWRLLTRSAQVRLEGGTFEMGSRPEQIRVAERLTAEYAQKDPKNSDERKVYIDKNLFERETPVRKVRLSTFAIDRYEVTCASFLSWLEQMNRAGKTRIGDCPAGRSKCVLIDGQLIYSLFPNYPLEYKYNCIEYINGHFELRPQHGRRPITSVSHAAAEAYCASHGQRLPTEAEWEFAARGRGANEYPWGSEPPACHRAVIERSQKFGLCQSVQHADEVPDLPDVGSNELDRTPQGVYDLAGSVMEWVADPFRERYPACEGICLDPKVSGMGSSEIEKDNYVIRGSAFSMDYIGARAATRQRQKSSEVAPYLGFRCAR